MHPGEHNDPKNRLRKRLRKSNKQRDVFNSNPSNIKQTTFQEPQSHQKRQTPLIGMLYFWGIDRVRDSPRNTFATAPTYSSMINIVTKLVSPDIAINILSVPSNTHSIPEQFPNHIVRQHRYHQNLVISTLKCLTRPSKTYLKLNHYQDGDLVTKWTSHGILPPGERAYG